MLSVLLLSVLACNQEGAEPPISDRGVTNEPIKPQVVEGEPAPDPDREPIVRVAGEEIEPAAGPDTPVSIDPALRKPPKSHAQAPATFQIEMDTTKGAFSLTCHRDWSPNGADRLHWLVEHGYYQDVAFFRVVNGFMAQFGIHGDPKLNSIYQDPRGRYAIKDDPQGVKSNTRGFLSFATAGPDTRTTQLFISYRDNSNLDAMGFTPVCEVDGEGMKIVDSLYNGYGEGAPRGAGPRQDFIVKRGNDYLRQHFPELDYLKSATIKK